MNFLFFYNFEKSETFIFSKGFSIYIIDVYRREDFFREKPIKI